MRVSLTRLTSAALLSSENKGRLTPKKAYKVKQTNYSDSRLKHRMEGWLLERNQHNQPTRLSVRGQGDLVSVYINGCWDFFFFSGWWNNAQRLESLQFNSLKYIINKIFVTPAVYSTWWSLEMGDVVGGRDWGGGIQPRVFKHLLSRVPCGGDHLPSYCPFVTVPVDKSHRRSTCVLCRRKKNNTSSNFLPINIKPIYERNKSFVWA